MTFSSLLVEWDFLVVGNYMLWHGCHLPGGREVTLRLVIPSTMLQEVLVWAHGMVSVNDIILVQPCNAFCALFIDQD